MKNGTEPKKTNCRHDKTAKMVRVRSEFNEPLAELKSRRASDVTQIVNDAIRKELESESLWPVEPLGHSPACAIKEQRA